MSDRMGDRRGLRDQQRELDRDRRAEYRLVLMGLLALIPVAVVVIVRQLWLS